MCGAVAATCGCEVTDRITHSTQTIKSMASSDDPCAPFAQRASLLCTELGCNSVLCLLAAREDTKLIRLPSGG